jgi:RNA recognition motif-containing protein
MDDVTIVLGAANHRTKKEKHHLNHDDLNGLEDPNHQIPTDDADAFSAASDDEELEFHSRREGSQPAPVGQHIAGQSNGNTVLPISPQAHSFLLKELLAEASTSGASNKGASQSGLLSGLYDTSSSGDEALDQRNLYVSGLAPSISEAQLKTMFEVFGEVASLKLMLNIHTGLSRGFAFVLFSDCESAHKAVAEMDHKMVEGQRLTVRFAEKRARMTGLPTKKIFIRNIPVGITERDVRNLFEPELSIVQLSMRPDPFRGTRPDSSASSRADNVAHVIFETFEAATQAAKKVHNTHPWPSCSVPVLAKVVDTAVRAKKESRARSAATSSSVDFNPAATSIANQSNSQNPTNASNHHASTSGKGIFAGAAHSSVVASASVSSNTQPHYVMPPPPPQGATTQVQGGSVFMPHLAHAQQAPMQPQQYQTFTPAWGGQPQFFSDGSGHPQPSVQPQMPGMQPAYYYTQPMVAPTPQGYYVQAGPGGVPMLLQPVPQSNMLPPAMAFQQRPPQAQQWYANGRGGY